MGFIEAVAQIKENLWDYGKLTVARMLSSIYKLNGT